MNCKVLVPRESIGSKAVLYFHGGGFYLGIYHLNREFAARMAKESVAEMASAIALISPSLDFAGKGESYLTKAKNDPFQLKEALREMCAYMKAKFEE